MKQVIRTNHYKNIPVLITGGCGFIGSHLAHKLVSLGAQVTVLDNLSTGTLENIQDIKHQITFIQDTIINPQACIRAAKNKKIIFHLAASISVPESIINPTECYATNITGTINVLEAARINAVDRFIFSSSAAVYGNYEGACHENLPCDPQSPYGYSKQIGELLCSQYTRNYALNTTCLRYFNVYGTRQNYTSPYAGVVAKFRHNIQHNLPIHLFGDGLQTRDFVPVETVVDANLKLALRDQQRDQQQVTEQIFNIATGTSTTLLSLIENLKKESPGYTGAIIFNPKRPGDVTHSYANCAKYQQLIEKINIF